MLLGAPVTTRTAAAGAAPVKPTVLQLQPVAEAAQELSVASEDDDKGTPFTINLSIWCCTSLTYDVGVRVAASEPRSAALPAPSDANAARRSSATGSSRGDKPSALRVEVCEVKHTSRGPFWLVLWVD